MTKLNRMRRVQVTAYLKLADGTFRVEDLGVYETATGDKARSRAVRMHAARIGWKTTKSGVRLSRGWYLKLANVEPCGCTADVPCLTHVVSRSERELNTLEARAAEERSVEGELDMAGPGLEEAS